MTTPHNASIENEISNSEQFDKIQNVFAATDPRQRSTPIEEEIFKLQCQHYEDDLPEIHYQTTLQDLLKEFDDIFDTESNEPARIPKVHVDLQPEFKGKRFF